MIFAIHFDPKADWSTIYIYHLPWPHRITPSAAAAVENQNKTQDQEDHTSDHHANDASRGQHFLLLAVRLRVFLHRQGTRDLSAVRAGDFGGAEKSGVSVQDGGVFARVDRIGQHLGKRVEELLRTAVPARRQVQRCLGGGDHRVGGGQDANPLEGTTSGGRRH